MADKGKGGDKKGAAAPAATEAGKKGKEAAGGKKGGK
jgi:hypothetical protein